jgi:Na+/melibiose symporter-like transporter
VSRESAAYRSAVSAASSLLTAALASLIVWLAGAPSWGWVMTGVIVYVVVFNGVPNAFAGRRGGRG